MERQITANGTDPFYMRPGRYIVQFGGVPAAGTVVALRAGAGTDGSQHLPVTISGVAFQITGGALPEPAEIALGGWVSLVTSNIAGSANLVAEFKRLPQAA